MNPIKRQQQEKQQQQSPPKQQQQQLQSKYVITNRKSEIGNFGGSGSLSELESSSTKTIIKPTTISSNLIVQTINGARRLSISSKPIDKSIIGINSKKLLYDNSNSKAGILNTTKQQLTPSSQSQSHHKQINTNKMKVMPLTGINNTVIPIIMTNVNQINVDNSTNVKTYQAGANKKSAMIAISTTPKLHSYRTTSSTAAAGAATVTSTTAITTTITATTPTPTSSNSIGESVALNKLLISSTASINNANIKNNPNNNNTNNSSSNNSNNNNNNNALVTTADQAVPSTSIIIRNQTAATHIKIQQQQQNQQHICKNNAAGVGVKEVHEESNNTMISSPHTTLLKTSLTQSGKQGQKQQQGQLQTKPQQQEQLQAQQSQQQPQQKQLPETIILNSNFKSKNKDGYLGKIVITRQQTLLQQQQHKEQKQQQHQESVIKPQQQQQQIKNNIEESKSKGQVLLNVNSKNLLNGLQSKIVTSATVTKAVTAAATAAAIATSNSVKLTASTANKVSIVPNLNKMITTTTTNSTSTITTASSNQNHHISLLQLQQQQQQQQPINKNDSASIKASGNGNAIVETNSLLKNNNDMIVSITNGHGHNTSNNSSNGNGNNNGTIKLEKSNDNSLLLKSNTSVNQNKNKDAPLNSDATNILNTTNKRLDFIQNFQQIRSEISLLKPLKNNHAAANINANNNIKEEVSLLKISNCKVTNVVENAMHNGGIKEINNHNNGNNNKKRESLLKAAPVTITTAAATASAATVPTTIEKSKILQMNKMPFSEPSPSVVKSNGSHFQRSQSLNSTEQQSDVNGERRNSEPLNNNNDKMNDIHFQHDKQPEMHEIFKVLKSKKEIEFNKNDIKNNNIETLIISVNETPITITTNTTAMTTTTVTAKNSTLSSVNCSKKIQSNVDDKNLHRNVKLHKNTNNVNHHDTNGVHGSGNDNDDDDDDDVTILPTQEQTEPIEIIDDDDEDENVNGYYNNSNDAKGFMTYKTKNSNEENVKNKSINNNLSLLCEEQVFMSSSSSGISNNSTEIMTTPTIIAKSTSVSSALVTKPSLRSPTSSLSPPLTVKVEKNPLPPVINNNSTPLLKKTLTESKLSGLMGSNDTSYSSVLDALSNFNMLSWRERVGTARSTNLKFQLNEFNLVQVHERCPPRLRIHTAYEKPINDRQITRQNQNQSSNVNYPDEAPLLYQCRRCRSYGPAVDFLAPEFCSLHCLKRDSQKRHREDNLRDNPRKRSKRTDVVSVPLLESTGPKFRWNSYLQDNQNAISAPISLFLNPFPTGPNNFKVGMKLEAIDPDNCSLFCVCTVIETNGYRLKLTFDGYDSAYDFWVNADSMDIFPPGWCCKTNHVLQPPKGISYNRFNWTVYLNKERATAAPRSLFTHLNASSLTSRNPFKIGMHLEAEDLNDTGKLCVATVADVLGDRIRIHFDGWDECYDIIVDINSPYIHPCGWHEGRQQLVVPPECENSSFNWPDYIRKHGGSVAASEELFESREPINFRPQMKLEVVDPRNPSLIRPATVMAHKGHRAKLHLDGWPADYCFWLEDDSPDLHPIGWCETTGHDLEPPPGFRMSEKKMPCPIVGCRGIGNTRKPSMSVHANRDCCPYAPENWRIVLERPLRLSYEEIVHPLPTAHETAKPTQLSGEKGNQNRLSNREILERLQIIDSIKPHHGPFAPKDNATISVPNDFIGFSKLSTTNVITTSNNAINTTIITTNSAILTTTPSQNVSKITVSTTPSPSSITSTSTTLMNTSNEMFVTKRNSFNMDFIDNQYDYEKYSDSDNSLNIKLHIAKQFLCDYGPRLQQNYDLWQKNFDFDNEKIKDNPMQWSITEVAKFIERHLNCAETAGVFKHECIDGTALLMLHQNDLTDNLGLKLGPSVRLYAYIIQLRTLAVTKFNVCYPITTNSK